MAVTAEEPVPPPAGAGGGLVRRLFRRFRALLHELGKFGTVGGIAFAVDLAVFNALLLGYHAEGLTAKTISTAVATTLAFAGNRYWTWRHRERSGLTREYLRYFLLNAVGLGIALACLAISHYGLGSIWSAFQTPVADNIAGQFVGTALGTTFRFWSYRRFVFLAPEPEHPGAGGDASPRPGDPRAAGQPDQPRAGGRVHT